MAQGKPRGKPRGRSKGKGDAKSLREDLLARMSQFPDAESLNDNVITPFVSALEAVCADRGYVLNIYGEGSNLVISTPDDASVIFQLVEDYFAAQEGDDDEDEET
tara:strand:- start:327 stop:641 length:315 start_codon:yes stop_codon:yes gene_type:complete